ncbi:MAG: dihydroorotase [Firmicutes bacterium]|nr:dihydroorotase [Bacillota bacterium]
MTSSKNKNIIQIPCFVDMHCHLRDPGQTHKEDIASGTASAVAGGFGIVACMPNTLPPLDNAEIIGQVILKAKEVGKCKVYPIGAITIGQEGKELTDFVALKKAGVVALSDDGRPVMDDAIMRQALIKAKEVGLLIISHCEDMRFVNGGVVNEGVNSAKAGLKGISRQAEDVMTARDVALATELDSPLHIAHVSTRGSVDIIRQAKAKGAKVTCETCPQYFSATDKEIVSRNPNAKINPPLRTDDDVTAIIEGIVDGTIDVIATDHAPHSKDEKDKGIETAPFGSVGFETAFSVAYTHLVDKGYITLTKLSQLMSHNPVKILGLTDKLELITVDTKTKYKVDAQKFVGRSKNSVFDGWTLKGKVIST